MRHTRPGLIWLRFYYCRCCSATIVWNNDKQLAGCREKQTSRCQIQMVVMGMRHRRRSSVPISAVYFRQRVLAYPGLDIRQYVCVGVECITHAKPAVCRAGKRQVCHYLCASIFGVMPQFLDSSKHQLSQQFSVSRSPSQPSSLPQPTVAINQVSLIHQLSGAHFLPVPRMSHLHHAYMAPVNRNKHREQWMRYKQ